MSMTIDLNNLRRFVGHDPSLVRQMVLAYLRFLPENIQNIKLALLNKDNETLLREIHQLKPNLMNIGVQLESLTFEELYQKLKAEGITPINEQLLCEAVHITERTIGLLQQELNEK